MITDISLEREAKLKSMFLDRVEIERSLLFNALNGVNLSQDCKDRMDKAIHFNLSQKFDDTDFDRFYPAHLFRVTRYCLYFTDRDSKNFENVLVTALMHNCFEKEIITEDELQNGYGSWTTEAIKNLTQDRQAMKEKQGRDSYYAKLYNMDPEVLMIKACDKLDNLFAQCIWDDESRREAYYSEVEDYIIPKLQNKRLAEYMTTLLKQNRQLGHFRPEYANVDL